MQYYLITKFWFTVFSEGQFNFLTIDWLSFYLSALMHLGAKCSIFSFGMKVYFFVDSLQTRATKYDVFQYRKYDALFWEQEKKDIWFHDWPGSSQHINWTVSVPGAKAIWRDQLQQTVSIYTNLFGSLCFSLHTKTGRPMGSIFAEHVAVRAKRLKLRRKYRTVSPNSYMSELMEVPNVFHLYV